MNLTNGSATWKSVLDERLPLFGHRNVIAIVDSAYPAQSRPGVETVVTGSAQIAVVRAVLEAVGKAAHVRPQVYLDQELEHVADADAPGVAAYRQELSAVLQGVPAHELPHERIIAMLDQTAQTFNVLILKTDLILPYTSVFVQLECGYWTDEAERRLRESLGGPLP